MPEGLLLVVWSSIRLWVVGWVGLWVQSFYITMGLVGLGQSFGGLGWIGLKKLGRRTTLRYPAWSTTFTVSLSVCPGQWCVFVQRILSFAVFSTCCN